MVREYEAASSEETITTDSTRRSTQVAVGRGASTRPIRGLPDRRRNTSTTTPACGRPMPLFLSNYDDEAPRRAPLRQRRRELSISRALSGRGFSRAALLRQRRRHRARDRVDGQSVFGIRQRQGLARRRQPAEQRRSRSAAAASAAARPTGAEPAQDACGAAPAAAGRTDVGLAVARRNRRRLSGRHQEQGRGDRTADRQPGRGLAAAGGTTHRLRMNSRRC